MHSSSVDQCDSYLKLDSSKIAEMSATIEEHISNDY